MFFYYNTIPHHKLMFFFQFSYIFHHICGFHISTNNVVVLYNNYKFHNIIFEKIAVQLTL